MIALNKYLIFFLIIASLYACRDSQKTAPVKTSADYEKAESFLNHKNDSAFYYFNKVATSAKDSLLIARAYNDMAVIQSDAGDYFGSQQSLLLSLNFLDEIKEDNRKCLASDYNELGNTNLNLKNYEAAIKYYDLALKFAPNRAFTILGLNNKAVAYQKKKQYTKSIDIYQSVIDSNIHKKEYARVLSNLAMVRWQQDSSYNAAPDLLKALNIRISEKDNWGLNASYARLSDYYSFSHPDLALQYANKMYAITRELNSPDDELEAIQRLITLGPAENVKQYFVRFQYLNDSLQTARNAAKNQFALIRYEADKKEADNLKLQKENADKKNQNIILFAALILLSILAYIIIRETHSRMRKKQLKMSKRVHDEVANGIYSIGKKIEHNYYINDKHLLDDLDIVYEQSRNISYEKPVNDPVDFLKEIKELLLSFSIPNIRSVLITGNEKELWDNINENVKHELKCVLQELMVNMSKHSAAKNVVIKFEQQNNKLHIKYSDDGIGLKPGLKKGNGLTNTENRINDIGGKLTFDSEISKGLKIHIYIPTA